MKRYSTYHLYHKNSVIKGFNNIYNISGSFMGICFNEYFEDVDQKRESIVTEYNFN